MGVDVVREKAFDGAGKLPVEPIDENGFENSSFEEDVVLPCRRGGRASDAAAGLFASFRCWIGFGYLGRRVRELWELRLPLG